MNLNFKAGNLWLLMFLLVLPGSLAYAKENIEILYFGFSNDTAFLGLGQGLEDSSNINKELGFRLKIESENFRPYSDPKPEAIFVAMGSESIRLLSILNPDIPIFNLIDDSTDVRALCLPNVFHIIPSEEMRRLTLMTVGDEKSRDDSLEALAWHSDYNIDTAAVLNSTFEQKRTMQLTEQAWSGWVAARIFSEAYTNKAQGNIIDYLKKGMAFDGHKSIVMRFQSDGQLRQSLLLIHNDKVIREVPQSDTDESVSFIPSYCS